MVAPHNSDIDAVKQAARRRAVVVRNDCDPAWGEALAIHVVSDLPPPPGAAVSAFWPMPGEIDTRPLLDALHARGHAVLLPRTPPRGQPLRFHRWRPGCEMRRERFGTLCPDGEESTPDVLFVPLLAFDRRGFRLGYGGGYYDRTLSGLPNAIAIGCAFAAQEVEHVPVDAHDIPLHAVATERGVIRCKDF